MPTVTFDRTDEERIETICNDLDPMKVPVITNAVSKLSDEHRDQGLHFMRRTIREAARAGLTQETLQSYGDAEVEFVFNESKVEGFGEFAGTLRAIGADMETAPFYLAFVDLVSRA